MVNYKMITLKIPHKSPSSYFWYFYRCINWLEETGIVKIEWFRSDIKERYVMLFYFNNTPIWIDVRDDNRLSRTYMHTKGLILKSNYSSELWDNPPETFPYKNEEWERKLRPRIRPFILGRAFGEPYRRDEFSHFFKGIDNPIYDIYSFSGTGLSNNVSLARLKTYEIFNPVQKKNLIFWLRIHGEEIHESVKQKASQFKCAKTADDIGKYYKQLNEAKYSINFPGICCSQPFRCIDAVIVNRAIISTKIWCDIYKSFPCIELPVCGYFGTGNWDKAEEIIKNLDKYDYKEFTKRGRDWYSWYLSPEGMWKNQILKQCS